MNNIYVGIDPSINSTGVCIIVEDHDGNKLEEKFYIIKSGKLTKKEDAAEMNNLSRFSYILYDKLPTTDEDNHMNEYNKAKNFMSIISEIQTIICQTDFRYNRINNIYVCQEGISYGSSTRTKSIFDLAGLNFLLREMTIRLSSHLRPVELIVATPGEIKKFSTGNGNANKETILNCFKAIYPDFDLPKMDDIADAYFMAKYAKHVSNKD